MARSSTSFKPGNTAGSGRPRGARNKATAEIQKLARRYCAEAIASLADIARNGKSESARVSACNALLDRAYGKPRQLQEFTGKDGEAIPFAVNVTIGSELTSAPEAG